MIGIDKNLSHNHGNCWQTFVIEINIVLSQIYVKIKQYRVLIWLRTTNWIYCFLCFEFIFSNTFLIWQNKFFIHNGIIYWYLKVFLLEKNGLSKAVTKKCIWDCSSFCTVTDNWWNTNANAYELLHAKTLYINFFICCCYQIKPWKTMF